jgi:integrase/recombinase XerD
MNNSSEMFNFSSRLWYNKRRVSKSGIVTLYLQVIINGKHKELPLNLKWPAVNIDLDAGFLLPRFKKDPEVSDYNLIIDIERGKHNEIHRTYRIRGEELDIPKFNKEVRVFNSRECFLTYMESESLSRLKRKEILRKTYQNVSATRALLKEYDPECLFKNIDVKWMKGFRQFMLNSGYMPSTIWSRIASTKTYLRLASLEPMLYVNEKVLDFPNPEPPYSTTYLNDDEVRRLMILYKSQLLEYTAQRVLGAFLFTCFTGLRISDLYRINAKWKISDSKLRFIPKKNERKGKTIEIEIMPMANHFVQKLTGLYFELPSEVEYNRSLKDIARQAEINKKLTSHVGRHTYGYLYMTTIGNQKGLQENLGHSKSETTERYANIDEAYQRLAVRKIQDKFSDLITRKSNDDQ